MNKKLIATIGLASMLGLAGCSTSSHKDSSMSGMSQKDMKNMNKTQHQASKVNPPLKQAFNDELNGFTKIQQDIKNKDYKAATTLASNLHDEFHAAILPPLKAKKGTTYAESIHAKYDELQDAISSKDEAKMNQLIKVNRDNLHTVAKILNVNLNQ
ncbi:hypothetical protein [Heyndrickxia acidicola]|uniref:Lipoprotein n=1 Tax=Heyndrickxia acidicola TaxID=209389 RepID=A0ABU6MG01_9BACI|nr:hypothetical protein [Heyndrickxia acidicola]MED1203614.1 hypothetical protein [Heyndrickxia acidicola]